jgi:ABC-type branched-subunit amino acid transport system ATPase component
MAAKRFLEVKGLHGWYGESHVLHGVDFHVDEGEVVTLLGTAGIDAIGSGPADYNRAILGENERLTKAVQLANIKSE